jgi:phthiocerol/phenolphthiocerol synthesis type-I polyketide synthase E
VSLPEAEVLPLLSKGGPQLSLAAVNSPTTAVVAGPIPEVDALVERLGAQDIHCTKLHTSHAFHSSMMDPILEEFRQVVRQVARRAPELPYISNVTGTWITAEEATSPDYWARHLRQAVRFASGVGELLKDPDAILLEVGPGQTLSTLVRQHPGRRPHHVVLPSLRHPREQQPDSAFLLGTLGRLWLAGVEPDWDGFYGEERRRRVPLPTYPFERQRHWVEPKAPASGKGQVEAPSDEKLPLGRWFYLPAWKPTPPLRSGAWSESHACWWVFASERPGEVGIGTRLAERLRAAGQDVVTVSPGAELAQIGPDRWSIPVGPGASVGGAETAASYRTLVERLFAAGRVPGRIVHLWNARAERPDVETALDRGFYSLLFLAQALDRQQHGAPLSLVVVTERMQGLGGAAPCPELATVLGPCRVLPQEYPHITCQAVDVALPAPHEGDSWQEAALIEQLLGECAAGSHTEPVVAYRGSRRWVQAFEAIAPERLDAQPLPLREQGVYLVLGGLGHIGYIQALMLARRARARLLLVGRSALPERADWETWLAGHESNDPVSRKIRKVQALEALGAEVMVARADVAGRAQLGAVVAQARARFGALHGVLYAAGTVDEGLFRALRDTRPEDMQAHLRSRLHGLRALAEVLQGQKLDFCLLASSLAAVLGGLGLATYAAATSFMDAFACAHAEETPTPWLSVDWDAWQFEAGAAPVGGQNPFGERAITDEEGERACETLLTLGVIGQVAVSTHALAWRLARWNRPADAGEDPAGTTAAEAAILPSAPGERAPRPQLQNAYVGPRNELETVIARLWEDTLGIDRVGVYDNFFELGGNSLVGVRLIARTREQFGVSIPAVSLYEGPTVQALANLIRQARGEAEASPDTEAAEPAEATGGRSRGERRRARRQRRGGALSEDPSVSAETEGEDESNS